MFLTPRRLFTAILFIALFVMATREIADPDFWWHLRTGQYIVETGTVPHSDIFSYTNAGQPWVAHEWLSEVFIYSVYQLGSFPALILTFSAIITLAFALAFLRCEGKPYIAAIAVLLAALATAPTWGVRPQMISLLLMSVFLVLLEWYRRQHDRSVWLLIPLTALWVNLHSGFALGLVLVAVYLVGSAGEHLSDWRAELNWRSSTGTLATVLVLCIGVVPLNPNGATMYVYPFETLTSHAMQTYIQEWFSPDFHLTEWQPYAWLLLATFGAMALSKKRPGLTDVLLLVGFGYAGLRSARNIPLFAVAAAPVLAEHLWSLLEARGWTGLFQSSPRVSRAMAVMNWLVLALILGAGAVRVGTVVANQSATESSKFPAAAVEFIKSHNLQDALYNSYGWGGYLIWKRYPAQRVYIDGRADVYGDKFIEEFLTAYRGGTDWRAPLDRYHVQLVLVEPDAPLAARLGQDEAWNRIYADSQAVLFQRKQ